MTAEEANVLKSMGLESDADILAAADKIAASSPFGSPLFGTSATPVILAAAEEIRAKGKPDGK